MTHKKKRNGSLVLLAIVPETYRLGYISPKEEMVYMYIGL